MVKTIDIEQLQHALKAGQVFKLYDNRGPGSFGALHIKGAEQLGVGEVADNLPEDTGVMLVFY